ncbi:hypothetical protein J6590_009392 [Homalodisca vitripennis]|nr:hypothetical protein J6590_009392 [Homalodisca vitripennis]
MEFEEYVEFNNDVAVCGDLTDEDILAPVQPSNPREDVVAEGDEEDARTESDRPELSTKDARSYWLWEVQHAIVLCFGDKLLGMSSGQLMQIKKRISPLLFLTPILSVPSGLAPGWLCGFTQTYSPLRS